MRKFRKKIAYALLSTTALFCMATGVFAMQSWTTSADGSTPEDTLIVPESYAQYLPLTAPADVAVNERYVAIADEHYIYVYDGIDDAYSCYTHPQTGGSQTVIKKLQFAENGLLYFADTSPGENFYQMDVEQLTAEKFNTIACGTFTVSENTVYFAHATDKLYSADLTDADAPPVDLNVTFATRKPTLAFWNGELYFTDNGTEQDLYKINPAEGIPTRVATPTAPIEHMTITAGALIYSTSGGQFYAYSLNDVSDDGLMLSAQGEYSKICAFGEKAYAVNGNKIQCFSTTQQAFTGFEICSVSNAPHRLNGAKALAFWGNKVFISDNGNARISVYDTKTQTLAPLTDCDANPNLIATDGQAVLTATGLKASLYDLSGNLLISALQTKGDIVGVASVYGAHYFVTDDNYFYSFTQTEEGVWQTTEVRKTSTRYPALLTSDAHGTLYIKSGKCAYAFTQTEFMTADAEGRQVCDDLPSLATQLSVDFKGNVYALYQNCIYKNGVAVSFETPLVYANGVTVQAFAFGLEENETYLLCDGNYLVKSTRLQLPTVKTIAVNGVDEEVFSTQSATVSVVKTDANAFLIAFDLTTLKGSEYFPYLSSLRSAEEKTALQIGETDEYALIAVYDKKSQVYDTYLLQKDAVTPLVDSEFLVEYAESERREAYITNQVNMYKFPYLTELLTVQSLPRNARVTLLGEIHKLDHEYYHVRYGEKTGYVPKSFISGISASPPEREQVTFGNQENNDDETFRMAYVTLGFAVICILVDYLLLHKKEK